jgi:AraC family transcriptional activator of pobA
MSGARRTPRRSAPRGTPSLAFRHNAKPTLGFEIFTLSSLYPRTTRAHMLAPHRHEFHSVYVGTRGRSTIYIDFEPVPIGAGLATFISRGRVVSFGLDGDAEAWMLVFTSEFLALDRIDPLRLPACLAPTWPRPVLALGADDEAEVAALVAQIDAEHARPLDAVQPWLLSALVRALLLRAERLVAQVVPPVPTALHAFFTILERDHGKTRSVAHYAKACALSPTRLGALVQSYVGKRPKQVIDERVVLEQKRLLAHTDCSVKELAARTGFDEPTNLVKFFRHHAGTTPLAFRAANRTP